MTVTSERLGRWLRRLADKVDYDNAPRATAWGFRFEQGKGLVWVEGIPVNRPPGACRVWFFPKDYEAAHNRVWDRTEVTH